MPAVTAAGPSKSCRKKNEVLVCHKEAIGFSFSSAGGFRHTQVGMPEPIRKATLQSRSASPRSRTSTGFRPPRPSHGV